MTVEIFLTGAPNFELPPKENYLGNCIKIEFEGVDIDLQKAMQVQKISCDYQMTNQSFLTGPAKWNNTMNLNPLNWNTSSSWRTGSFESAYAHCYWKACDW